MATPNAAVDPVAAAAAMEDPNDPFVTADSPPDEREPRHRYTAFNSQLFSLGPNASPIQAKRALEAHLAETDRRMEEAGKLGTALVQQRKELTQRLAEVDKLQAEGQVSEDLRQRLVEIEKDYNDVARESARAFLPKPRVPSNEATAGSPFVPEGRGGRRSVSPSKFEAQATASPTKLGVPNRKLRNQPANRIHDIEFAAEISQSLIVQVRNLQALLAEKEEELKDVKLEKSKLEYETEGFQQRIKSLDESQSHYKDENWSLETQVHELEAAQRELTDREKKLQQTVSVLEAEKNTSQRELDEVKLSHSKLTEEHTAAIKHHDTELGAAKRNIFMAESERAAMVRKIEDLTGQNLELAKAVSSMRGRALDAREVSPTSEEDFATANDDNTPEHSPPMSPIKGTPRHSLLESETLKTSLQHAQRTIQSLRTNVHREKTEKLELRRMLQDARDELERVRSEPVPHKRPSKALLSREFKKPPRLLGSQRSSRTEIIPAPEDAEWEDQPASSPPNQPTLPGNFTHILQSTERDNYDTANETVDQGFDTANEMGAETDDFHTGAEEFSSSDDAETETESPSKRVLRGKQSNLSVNFNRRASVASTASSTEDEYYEDTRSRTPTSQLPPLHNRFPLRGSRGAGRRSRQNSEGLGPPGSAGGTPQHNQSLAAELGDFSGSDNESALSATPSRRSILSRPGSMRGTTASPPPPVPRIPKPMVDDGTMTEDVEESDTHAADLESMRQEHAQQIEQLHASTAEDHAAAVAVIESRHAAELQRAVEEARAAHARELDALKADHSDEKNKAMAVAAAAHVREVESLHADHQDKMTQMQSEYSATHASELDSLKSRHVEELQKTKQASDAAHAAELAALVKAHTAQIELAKNELIASHAKDLEALKASYAAQIEQSKQTSDAAHAKELEALQANHLGQIEEAKKAIASTHQQELESLKSVHATQVEQSKKDSEAAHSEAIGNLAASHAKELESSQSESAAALAQALETLQSAHQQEMESSKADADARLAGELDAVRAEHARELDLSKAEMEAKFVADLDALKSTHTKSLEESKAEGEARLTQELAALRDSHSKQIDALKVEADATLSREIESIKASHSRELEILKKEADAAHAAELAALGLLHTQQLSSAKSEADSNLSKELASLKQSHAQELDLLRSEHAAVHAKELEGFKAALANQLESSKSEGNAAHSQQIEAIKAANAEIVEAHKRDSEKALEQALESAKSTHERELESLKNNHAASRSKEVEELSAKHASELEDLRTAMDAAKVKAVEELTSQHKQHINMLEADGAAAKTKEVDELSSSYDKQIEALKADAATTKLKELQDLAVAHQNEIESLKVEISSSKEKALEELVLKHKEQIDLINREASSSRNKELDELKTSHAGELESLKGEHNSAIARLTEELAASHTSKLEALRCEHEALKAAELAALSAKHDKDLESLKDEHGASQAKELQDIKAEHAALVAALRSEHQETLDKALEDLKNGHAKDIDSLNNSHSTSLETALVAIKSGHNKELDNLKAANEASLAQALATANQKHTEALEAQKAANEISLSQALDNVNAKHLEALEAQKASHADALAQALDAVNGKHAEALEAHQAANEASLAQALSAAKEKHAEALGVQQAENEAALTQALEDASSRHAKILEAQRAESIAERENLLASHALELDALRRSLAVTPPALGYSSMSTIETKPVVEPRALTAAREAELPQTPSSATAAFGTRRKGAAETIIAEDDTRQSPSAVPNPETPESQRPFREMSTNTDARPGRKQDSPTAHQGSQTTLTSDGIDRLFKHQRHSSHDSVKITVDDNGTPATLRHRRSQEIHASLLKLKSASFGSPAPGQSPAQRPSSAGSAMSSKQTMPPLPANHKEVIEAARTGSSHGGKSSMGPPLLPASAYRASVQSRASHGRPQSPASGRGTPTSRGLRVGSAYGTAELAPSSTRLSARSRQSSVSSFASEIDTRFNIRPEMGMGVSGFVGPHTDPRMIQAITQTMIGEYLWKYTRKPGRGEMSEKRHRRYFWVHPYTRTLYWSDRDPSVAGRAELRAKSVPIEAVRVVADDNPMPPGLHRKSLIVISPGRTIKFTCTTGQRHETWFNALSYLLLRTGDEGQADAEEMVGNITQEDVDEFNPSYGRRSAASRRAPPSISSYNSRTTRADSPAVDLSIPTLTPTHERVQRPSTLGRLSGYLGRNSSSGGTGIFSSMRSRSHGDNIQDTAIYETGEANDSAEELREIMEQQERESDRLENVRACCDGKHDVGTLSHATKRHRHSHGHAHTHTHPAQSTTPTPIATVRSKA